MQDEEKEHLPAVLHLCINELEMMTTNITGWNSLLVVGSVPCYLFNRSLVACHDRVFLKKGTSSTYQRTGQPSNSKDYALAPM